MAEDYRFYIDFPSSKALVTLVQCIQENISRSNNLFYLVLNKDEGMRFEDNGDDKNNPKFKLYFVLHKLAMSKYIVNTDKQMIVFGLDFLELFKILKQSKSRVTIYQYANNRDEVTIETYNKTSDKSIHKLPTYKVPIKDYNEIELDTKDHEPNSNIYGTMFKCLCDRLAVDKANDCYIINKEGELLFMYNKDKPDKCKCYYMNGNQYLSEINIERYVYVKINSVLMSKRLSRLGSFLADHTMRFYMDNINSVVRINAKIQGHGDLEIYLYDNRD